MAFQTRYEAKFPDDQGVIQFTDQENQVWRNLMNKQLEVLPGRVCDEYLEGLKLLKFPADRIPQGKEISESLTAVTGWSVEPVPALIPDEEFYGLLANKRFPIACFIRTPEDFDYITEPDIFHELFGHCPLLTNEAYAAFTENYGKLVCQARPEQRCLLARLYWFTIEFGLIQTKQGLRSYGGGIISSPGEVVYSVESDSPERRPFSALDAMRTPFCIDIMQPLYYVIDDFSDLFDILEMDLLAIADEAIALGDFEPMFEDSPDAKVIKC